MGSPESVLYRNKEILSMIQKLEEKNKRLKDRERKRMEDEQKKKKKIWPF